MTNQQPKQRAEPASRAQLSLAYSNSATNVLAARAEKLLAENPSMTMAEAFARVFADPDNRSLVIQSAYEP